MSERFDATLSADAPSGSGGSAAPLPRTALLYADETLLGHVEQALAALRVPVVYRAAIAQDHSAMAGAHPEIALINLDDRCGEELDPLTAMLDAAGVPIVFNDADISKGLEGWARARWARHLCAKLCGNDDVDPPRPTEAAKAIAASSSSPSTAAAAAPVATAEPVVAAGPAAVAEPPAPVVEFDMQDPGAQETIAAAGPLSQGEIDSLVVDFPSGSAIDGDETEALSAHVDALLADAPDSASQEPAPWEVMGFADEEPASQPAPATAQSPAAPAVARAPSRPAAVPSADQWQLVDDFTPNAAAPGDKPAAPQPAIDISGLSLELEPLDPAESGP